MNAARSLLLTVMAGAFLIACPTDPEDTEEDTGTDDTAVDDTVIPDLINHDPEFDLNAVVQQAYWYSRYNLGSLVMKSGNGQTFMPNMEMVGNAVMMVSDDESTATPPANPALLKRVYNTGTPTWASATDGNPGDFGDERWAPATDTQTTGAAAGWTIMKEVEWARQFHIDAHFGEVGSNDGIPGAQQRFAGIVLYMEAANQALEWKNAPEGFDTSDPGGQYVMMAALVDLSDATTLTNQAHASGNRYQNVAMGMAQQMGLADADALAAVFMGEADAIFDADPAVSDIDDLSAAVQGLTWYAAFNATNRDAAKARLIAHADTLLAAQPDDATADAHRIRGLLEAFRVTGNTKYQEGATASYLSLEGAFDWEAGVFTNQSTYTTDDVAAIVGALNAADLFGDSAAQPNTIALIEHWFESSVNLSGLQISAPPMAALPPYEQQSKEIFHRHPVVPMPPAAGGANGTAPVFASDITWSDDAWTATNTFDTAGAMHLANEMLWHHVDEVNGFPVVP